jgi:HEPN domain-containing protein
MRSGSHLPRKICSLLIIRSRLRQPWHALGFHAQQAAEKYLKAFLVFKGIRPEFTHDVGSLLMSCRQYDPSLEYLIEDCEMLTDFAVDARYEYDDRPSEMTAREAIEAARRVTEAIRSRL